jgi:hypothetical protein
VSADDRNHRGATGPPTTALATVGSPPIKIRVVERGLGAEADEPTLHMQMAGLARLLASPGFGDLRGWSSVALRHRVRVRRGCRASLAVARPALSLEVLDAPDLA